MAYVIAEPCIGTKDNSCVEVCPVDCIHPTPDEPDYDNGRDALHRPGGVHRLRRLRRGLPGRRLLRRGPAPRASGRSTRRSTPTTSRAAEPALAASRPSAASIPAGAGCAAAPAAGDLQDRQLDREHRDEPARRLADRLRGRVVGVGRGPAARRRRPARAAASSAAPCPAAARRARRRAPGRRPRRRSGSARRRASMKPAMFSTTPAISRLTLWAISADAARDLLRGRLRRRDDQELRLRAAAGRASSRRRRCPAAGRRAGSPARPSRRPRGTASAPCAASARARRRRASSSTKKPIDMTFTPWASSGRILRSAETGGRWPPRPNMRGIE